ncbi:MAG: TonB family protein [Bacteroidaceae bacterium]|nr:TonB family protein [Bacteroidaceae bacterium]
MEYILKSAVTLALLYSLFFFFLKKETFHKFNRVCLLFTLVGSLVLPLVHVTLSHPTAVNQAVMASTTYVTTLPTIVITPETKAPLFTWNDVLAWIYWIGLCVMLLYLALQIVQTYLLLKGGLRHTDKFGNTIILKDDVKSPFSIFHFIVMSVEDYEKHRQNILTHEQEHIRMRHSYDLLLLEVVKVLQWFNPFVWFLENDLKALHEYQADEAVINQGIDAKQYQQLLVVKAVGNRLQPFANNLRRGSLKKRIIMMYQKKSNRWMMLKALFILPVTCFAIYAFATPEADAQVQQVKKTAVTQQKKATPAPQKKDVTVNIKMGDKTGQGTLSKEKAEQLKKDTEAKFGNKVKVTLSESTPKDRTVQNIKKEDIKGTAYESVDQALQAQSAIIDCPEELAQFPGGDEACYKWLADHVKYPEEAKKNGIQGRVHVHFVVEKNGEITDVKVLRSPNPLLAEEAERVVKSMPLWKPAKNKGEIVRSSFNLPLSFRLSSPEPSKE